MNIRAAVSKDGDARIVEVKKGFGEGAVIIENLEGQKEEPRVCYDDSKCENLKMECDKCVKFEILMGYEKDGE